MSKNKKSAVSDIYEKLQRASRLNVNYIYPSLVQMLGYRQRVAEQVLDNPDNTELKETYIYANKEIKDMLAL